MSIEWDPVSPSQVRGIIRGYTITYKPVEVYYITRVRRSLTNLQHAATMNTSLPSAELEDLLFHTNYSVHVQAYTVDNGVPSSEFHFITPEGGRCCSPRKELNMGRGRVDLLGAGSTILD